MDNRIVKLQVKVYLEGDEEHALMLSHDIFQTYGVFTQFVGFAIPSVDNWVKEAVRRLYSGSAFVRRSVAPDPEMVQKINIVGGDQQLHDIKIEESDAGKEVTVIDEQESIKVTDSANAEVSIQDSPDNLEKEDALDVVVTPNIQPNERGKKKIQVIVRQEALKKAIEHAKKDTTRETGGVMLGTFLEDETTITVVFTGIVQALSAVRETSTVKFLPETWAEIWNAIDHDENYSDENIWHIIGWYHTHPGMGIFLSGYDKFIQKEYFTRKGHLALVIDPINNKEGFFINDEDFDDTPELDQDIKSVKDDKALQKKLKSFYKGYKKLNLPSSEITVPKEVGHE